MDALSEQQDSSQGEHIMDLSWNLYNNKFQNSQTEKFKFFMYLGQLGLQNPDMFFHNSHKMCHFPLDAFYDSTLDFCILSFEELLENSYITKLISGLQYLHCRMRVDEIVIYIVFHGLWNNIHT